MRTRQQALQGVGCSTEDDRSFKKDWRKQTNIQKEKNKQREETE